MSYPTIRSDRYRKAAEELSHLAESASSDFIRRYYQRTAERCLLVAEGEEAPLPKWATAAARNESSTLLSDKVITSVPEQAMPPLDEAITSMPEPAVPPLGEAIPSVPDQATAPLPNQAILSCGTADQPQQSDAEPTPVHSRGATHVVRQLARRVRRLASRSEEKDGGNAQPH
jgi:hypothetical protein